MNNRQAKRIALEVILCLIDMEVFNPTELPYTLLNEYGFDVDDYAKLRDAIEDIAAVLKNKMDNLDSSLEHIREYGTWIFSEKDHKVDMPASKGLIPVNCSVIEMLDWALESTLESLVYAQSKIKWDTAQGRTDDSAIKWHEKEHKRYQRLFAAWERRTNVD